MKTLLNGCAVVALWSALACCANAQIVVRDAPVAKIPTGDDAPAASAPALAAVSQAGPDAAATPLSAAPAQPASVQPASVLTDDERAFFGVVGRHVTDAATAYQSYVSQVTAINAAFSDPESVQRALRTGADYQPEQLQEGIIAYAALIALRNQAFVDGVRADRDPALADRLADSPEAVLEIPGAREAAQDTMGVLGAHGLALQTSGGAITKAAYDVQAQPWSRSAGANPVDVLVRVKASAAHPRTADEPSEKSLLQSLVSAPRGSSAGGANPSKEVMHGLALAALAMLGRTGDKEDAKIAVLLRDPLVANCLKLAKMNLNQCLAAAGPHYDHVFCTGQHAVGETAGCVSSAAAADGAAPAAVDPAPRRMAANDYGPEEAAAYGYPAPADRDEAPASAPVPAADAPAPYQYYTPSYGAAASADPQASTQDDQRPPAVY